MECLKSFPIELIVQKSFTNTGVDVKTWGIASNYHWIVADVGNSSVFNIEGFKRLDIYGIEMIGSVVSRPSTTDSAIVQDYSFQVSLNGTNPLVSGNVAASPNYWPINQKVNSFDLSKYTNKVYFQSPYMGVTSINFENFNAQGNNAFSSNAVNLDIHLTFIFYYKYDGE